MNINPISSNFFKGQVKVIISDKNVKKGTPESPLNQVVKIANSNNTSIFIGKDVVILNSSQKIKDDLKKCGYTCVEINEINSITV